MQIVVSIQKHFQRTIEYENITIKAYIDKATTEASQMLRFLQLWDKEFY